MLLNVWYEKYVLESQKLDFELDFYTRLVACPQHRPPFLHEL